jgi:hypothetical protein
VLHSALFTRESVERAGGFEPSDWEAADYDLYLRIARDHPAVCHGQVVAERRIHDTQASRANAPMLRSALRILRRQWPAARRDPARRAAYAAGVHHYQDWFGEKLVVEAWLLARQGRWLAAASLLGTLLRWHPAGARALLRGLPRSNALQLRVVADAAQAPAPAPVTVAEDGNLALLALDPAEVVIGVRPAKMQGDLLELGLGCRNATARTVAIMDGVPLDTRFTAAGRLVALVPPDLLRTPGTRTVYLLNR